MEATALARLRGRDRARYVSDMFARIATRYDLLNTLMSAGRHHAWRRATVRMTLDDERGPALDVATGTGDLAFELLRHPQVEEVVGLDFTQAMLPVARRKARRLGFAERSKFIVGDAHALPFPDDRFLCATVGFGARNFIDLPLALREMTRVVRPGGRVAILEIVRQEGIDPIGRAAPALFRRVAPILGAVFASDREAYTYLPESVQSFLTARELADLMREAGLEDVRGRSLALGFVTAQVGVKPGGRGCPAAPTSGAGVDARASAVR